MSDFNGYQRAKSHTLFFAESPSFWQNGLAVGNGQYGGLFYQPEESIFEYAVTRLNLWKRNLVGPGRLSHAEVLEKLQQSPKSLLDALRFETGDTERPGFKPGGRICLEMDRWHSADLNHNMTLFDRRMRLDLANGEVVGNYEISAKASEWTAFALFNSDITVIRVRDTYCHNLCRFDYRQKLSLYRLPDPDAEILSAGVTEDNILYLEFGFKENLRALMAVKVAGVPVVAPSVGVDKKVSIEIALNYCDAGAPMGYYELHTPDEEPYQPQRMPVVPREYVIYHALLVDEEGTRKNLLAEARTTLLAAETQGFAVLQKQNRAWWRKFWRRSGIAIESPALEGLWYSNLYTLATTSRGPVAPGLFGLWNGASVAPWHGDYHGDINFSMYTWPLFALNHPELLEGVFKTLEGWFPEMRKEAKERFGVADGLRFPQATGPLGQEMSRNYYRMMRCSTGFYAENYWKWYCYDPDPQRLRATILPVLEAAARYYFIYCYDDESHPGKVKIGPSWAPEQGVFPAWNVSNDLAVFKQLFAAVVKFNRVLQQWSPTAEKAAQLLEKFPDYPQLEGEFLSSASEKRHDLLCHPSFLAAIVPCDDIDGDSPLAEIAIYSMRNYLNRTCRKGLVGKIGSACDLTWGWLFASAIRLRDREYANLVLHKLALADFVKSNGMFAYIGGRVCHSVAEKRRAFDTGEGQKHAILGQSSSVYGRAKTMCMVQSGCGFLFGVMESMLQSHGGDEIKLFPVPLEDVGKKQSFHNLAAQGGLTVSAAHSGKSVLWCELTAGKYEWHGVLRFFDGRDDAHIVMVNPQGTKQICRRCGQGRYLVSIKPRETWLWKKSSSVTVKVALPPHKPGVRRYGNDCPIGYGEAQNFVCGSKSVKVVL
ncbi:MAG: hypothetical protein GX946_11140 [Oligosphaeraceae bacterium]|nr:hypothetical protein [Oligosphaeraceae bacterium]